MCEESSPARPAETVARHHGHEPGTITTTVGKGEQLAGCGNGVRIVASAGFQKRSLSPGGLFCPRVSMGTRRIASAKVNPYSRPCRRGDEQ